MINVIFRVGAAVAMIVCLSGCSGSITNQTASDPNPTVSDGQSEFVITPEAGDTDTTISAPDNTPSSGGDGDADTNALCNGKPCEEGQSCIEYFGFAGNPLHTCGIPCKPDAPNDGCPETMRCQVIPDGPTQCVDR